MQIVFNEVIMCQTWKKKKKRGANVNEKCFASMQQSSQDRSVFDTHAATSLVYSRA